MEEPQAVVIDNGSYCLRAGLVGNSPTLTMPCCTLTTSCDKDWLSSSVEGKDSLLSLLPKELKSTVKAYLALKKVGQEALDFWNSVTGGCGRMVSENYILDYPIDDQGVVTDWQQMEELWNVAISSTGKNSVESLGDTGFFLTDGHHSAGANRETGAELAFERFHFGSFSVMSQALLSCLVSGRSNGILVDMGHSAGTVLAFTEGEARKDSVHKVDFSGAAISRALYSRLLVDHPGLPSGPYIDSLKKEVCCVRSVGDDADKRVIYTLPDGRELELGEERWDFMEPLMDTTVEDSLPSIIRSQIKSVSDSYWQPRLKSSIILTGGTTMMPGFVERLGEALGPEYTIIASPQRAQSSWLGGSIMASLSTFTTMAMTRREYEEEGAHYVHTKCRYIY